MLSNFAKLLDAADLPSNFGLFCDFTRAGEVATGDMFTGTAISSGTLAVKEANGGWGRLSGAATTDDSGYQIQGLAAHAMTTNKPILFKTRMQLGETTSSNVAVESDWFVGLFPTDTSIVASVPIDGIYFTKSDAANSIKCEIRVNNATPTLSVTLPSTFIEDKAAHYYGIKIIPNGTTSDVEFTIDDVTVYRAINQTLPASTVFLAPTIAFQSGDNTGTKFLDVDYVGVAQAR